jgi:heme-degrading monooxygenase HmoA
MIRVIYRWEVQPKDFDDFRRVWSVTTNRIHESVPGALGSFMLRASDRDSEVLTVAKWESEESWRKFWGKQNPEEMQEMRKLGRRVSVEAYNEIDDYTR